MHLNNGAAPASLTVSSSTDTISAPVELDSSVTITPAAATALTISGPISGNGSLTMNGGGTLLLSDDNSCSGATTVTAGELVVTSITALPSGSLTVLPGATLILDTSAGIGATNVQPASGNLQAAGEAQTASTRTVMTVSTRASILPAAALPQISRTAVAARDGTFQAGSLPSTTGSENWSWVAATPQKARSATTREEHSQLIWDKAIAQFLPLPQP